MKKVRLPDRPFPDFWEQSTLVDRCPHQWETVAVELYPGTFDEVDRCRVCHTPRCDRASSNVGRCTQRRHHRTVHIFPDGKTTPVGG